MLGSYGRWQGGCSTAHIVRQPGSQKGGYFTRDTSTYANTSTRLDQQLPGVASFNGLSVCYHHNHCIYCDAGNIPSPPPISRATTICLPYFHSRPLLASRSSDSTCVRQESGWYRPSGISPRGDRHILFLRCSRHHLLPTQSLSVEVLVYHWPPARHHSHLDEPMGLSTDSHQDEVQRLDHAHVDHRTRRFGTVSAEAYQRHIMEWVQAHRSVPDRYQ